MSESTPPPGHPTPPHPATPSVPPTGPRGLQVVSLDTPRSGAALVSLICNHASGFLLAAIALFFTFWFALTNPGIVQVFRWIFGSWSWGDDFEFLGMAWGVFGVALFTLIGWIYLEGHELYLPRTARLALAYIFGLGISGFVFECLAIPYRLTRPWVAVALAALVLVLLARAWLRGRRAPESGFGGGTEWREQVMRRVLARQAFEASLARPANIFARHYCILALLLIGAITFFIFWHALLYPEVYWDSLILYLGYARQTFLAHGFPVKVTGQVGIGLGANYPHLFSVLGSGVAALSGFWSELPQRLIAPLAGLATTVLVYHAALRLTRHVGAALTVALLYRATPLGIIYDQYASDYALVLLFTAAFLYLALLYIETGLSGYLAASAMLIALSMHLNYLMGIMWVPWALAVVLAHTGAARRSAWKQDPDLVPWAAEAPWTLLPRRTTLFDLLTTGRFWTIVLLAAVVGSTWYFRNWIVTGNPVYAFFYKILGGKHINDEVMQASAIEWGRNGAGIGRLGETFAQRLRNTFGYFAGPYEDKFWFQYYQTAPLTLGFALGGGLVWLGRLVAAPFGWRKRPVLWGPALRFGWIPATLFFGLLAFHYILAPFYLYQIIGILPCLALLAALAWPLWRRAPWRHALAGLALWVGVVPGVAVSLMGYKIVNMVNPVTQDSQMNLFALRHPLPSARQMYRWRYGDDAVMWDWINERLKGQRLLTHENRDLALDPSITIVNLDDWTDRWNIQALWAQPDQARRVRTLVRDYNIHYYLRVPNEDACPTNAQMGTADWPGLGLAKLIYEAGENRLYELIPPEEKRPAARPVLTLPRGVRGVVQPMPKPSPTPAKPATANPVTTGTQPGGQ